MKAIDFDEKFDSGDDISEFLNIKNAKKVNQILKRINLDIPIWMIEDLDKEAIKIGVTRQSIIKVWLAEKLESRANLKF